MNLESEAGDVVEEADEVAERLRQDISGITGVEHDVELSNVNDTEDHVRLSFSVIPDLDELENRLTEADEDYYGGANMTLVGSYQVRVMVER